MRKFYAHSGFAFAPFVLMALLGDAARAEDAFVGYFPSGRILETHEDHEVSRNIRPEYPVLQAERVPYSFDVYSEEGEEDYFDRLATSSFFDPLDPEHNVYVLFSTSLKKMTQDGQELWMLDLRRDKILITAFTLAERGNFAYLGMRTGDVHVVNTLTHTIVKTFSNLCRGPCQVLRLFPDETALAIGDINGTVSLVQPQSGQVIGSWKIHQYPVQDIRVLQETHGAFLLSHDRFEIAVRNLDDNMEIRRMRDRSLGDQLNIWIDAFDLVPGRSYAMVGSGVIAKLIDFRTGQVVQEFGPTLDNLLSIRVSEDETRVIGFSSDLLLYTWDIDSQELLSRGYLPGQVFSVYMHVAISRDGRSVALTSMDPEIAFPPKMFSRVRIFPTSAANP